VEQRTQVLSTQVLPSRLPDLEKGKVVSSVAAARRYIANLVQESARAAPINPAFAPPASTSTVPRGAP
jgi:hypothetical protein